MGQIGKGGEKRMKKIWMILIVGVITLVGAKGGVYAAATADITVTVMIRSLSVVITSGSPWAIGTINAGIPNVITTAIVVTNNGNAAETYQLKLTNPGTWEAVLTDLTHGAAEKYQLGAIFQTTSTAAPVEVDFVDTDDFVSTGYVTCSATVYAKATGSGVAVAAGGARDLWLYFHAPESTSVTTSQTITITVNATAA